MGCGTKQVRFGHRPNVGHMVVDCNSSHHCEPSRDKIGNRELQLPPRADRPARALLAAKGPLILCGPDHFPALAFLGSFTAVWCFPAGRSQPPEPGPRHSVQGLSPLGRNQTSS